MSGKEIWVQSFSDPSLCGQQATLWPSGRSMGQQHLYIWQSGSYRDNHLLRSSKLISARTYSFWKDYLKLYHIFIRTATNLDSKIKALVNSGNQIPVVISLFPLTDWGAYVLPKNGRFNGHRIPWCGNRKMRTGWIERLSLGRPLARNFTFLDITHVFLCIANMAASFYSTKELSPRLLKLVWRRSVGLSVGIIK